MDHCTQILEVRFTMLRVSCGAIPVSVNKRDFQPIMEKTSEQFMGKVLSRIMRWPGEKRGVRDNKCTFHRHRREIYRQARIYGDRRDEK
jgi:hypothetical protein